ncbi:MAG: hypothetical protein JXA46_19975 [Dehalococcoidales bacterium]|nr:hypothetical protein [Dehalococcoidales bacterium]
MKIPWLMFGFRFILGVIFIVASVNKLPLQSQFVNEVISYGLLPHNLATVYGIVLPWFELVIGCSLILGVFTIASLVFCLLVTISFILANIFALSQDIINICGCFGPLISLNHATSLSIDIVMILISGLLLFFWKQTALLNIDYFLPKICSNRPKTPGFLTLTIIDTFIVLVLVLAIGLPLKSGG